MFNKELFNSSKFSLRDTTNTEAINVKTSITGMSITAVMF